MKNHIKQMNQRIRLCLSEIELHSDSAERLILITGAVESRYQYLRQYPSGIARSYWQIETATCLDNIKNYLVFRKSRLKKIADSCMISTDTILELNDNTAPKLLEINLHFAICMARIKYYRVPKKLPDADDIEGLGQYYIKYYNAGGKSTMKKWMDAQKLL